MRTANELEFNGINDKVMLARHRSKGYHLANSDDHLSDLKALLEAIDAGEISYCHWKSNLRLDLSLAGETDLDLLVLAEQRSKFQQLLKLHRIARVLAPPGKRYPALEDYVGFDSITGKTFHLHVHYQLVLGEQFVKNYSLPLEKPFLENTHKKNNVRIPAPEWELIALSMRALLKYRDRDAIKDIFEIRYPGIPDPIRFEMLALMAETSLTKVRETLEGTKAGFPTSSILHMLEIVAAQERGNGFELVRLRAQVRKGLKPYQRMPRLAAQLVYLKELWRRRNSLRISPYPKMSFPATGKVIAITGADGSGKTTHNKEISNWLGEKLEVRSLYLGSKQPSRTSRSLYIAFRAARKATRDLSRMAGEDAWLVRMFRTIRQALRFSHEISIGRDRLRRYRNAKRLTSKGFIVIFDRFPLEGILDGPQVEFYASEALEGNGRLAAFFSRWEKSIYAQMQPPADMIWLDVSPKVAETRKPDHTGQTILAKIRLLNTIYTEPDSSSRFGRIWRINSDLPYHQVSLEIKRTLWNILTEGYETP